jgi:hypothetical protein
MPVHLGEFGDGLEFGGAGERLLCGGPKPEAR